ncbi:MAG: rRNA methyltransferase [Chloroflexi bacterium]|nr:MAG: rRNA methyltransferase [Chloroflexota bacterium]
MITSIQNPKVKFVRRLQAEKRFRHREAAFVVEGTRWLHELIKQAHLMQLVFVTEAWQKQADNQDILQQVQAPVQVVTGEVMRTMSDTETPPGVLAIGHIAPLSLPQTPTFLLILDGVNTPGNLGTMLRAAAAAGTDGVLLAPGCVDAYNPKVLRGSMGAHVRLPVHELAWEEIKNITQGMSVWVTAVSEARDYTHLDWTGASAVIIGNEARGVGTEARQIANGRLTIPMHHNTESLNAATAAAVILFEAARQRRNKGAGTN